MSTIHSLVLRLIAAPDGDDQSLPAISMLACLGLAVSLGLVGFGFDLGATVL